MKSHHCTLKYKLFTKGGKMRNNLQKSLDGNSLMNNSSRVISYFIPSTVNYFFFCTRGGDAKKKLFIELFVQAGL